MAIQRIERYGKFQPSPIDESRVRRMEQLAGLAGGIAQTARAFGEARAEEEAPEKARKAVEEAVETGQELPVGRGYGADAFNREAVSAYLSTIDLDVKNKLNDLAETNKDNPENFVNDANGYLDGLTKSVPKEYKEQIFSSVQERIKRTANTVTDNFLVRARQTNQNAITDSINQGIRDLGVLAQNNDPSLQSEKELVFLAMDALAESNPVYATKLTEEKRNVEKSIYSNSIAGRLNDIAKNQSPKEAYEELIKIEEQRPDTFSVEEWPEFIGRQQDKIRKTESLINSAQKVITAEEQEFFDGYITGVSLGINQSYEDTARAMEIAKTDKQIDQLNEAIELGRYSESDYQTRLNLYQTAISRPETTGLAVKMQKQEKRIQTQLSNDAYGFAVRQEVADDIPIDLLNPTSEQIDARRNQANIASEFYQRPIPPLNDSEINFLVNTWPKLTPEEQATLANAYGPQSFIWSKFSDKNAGVYAQGAANPNPETRQLIFDGQAKIDSKAIEFVQGAETEINSRLINYLGMDTVPDQDFVDFRAAALAVYASKAGQDKINLRDLNFELLDQSFAQVIGDVPTIREFKTILPFGINEDDFEDYFDNMTEEELQRISPVKRDETEIENILDLINNDENRIKAISDNQYVIVVGDTEQTPQTLMANNQPITFTINQNVLDSFFGRQAEITNEKQAREFAKRQEQQRIINERSQGGLITTVGL